MPILHNLMLMDYKKVITEENYSIILFKAGIELTMSAWRRLMLDEPGAMEQSTESTADYLSYWAADVRCASSSEGGHWRQRGRGDECCRPDMAGSTVISPRRMI